MILRYQSVGIAIIAATGLLLAGCSSEDDLGTGILVVRDDSVELCESYNEVTDNCEGRSRLITPFQILDQRSVDMIDFDTAQVSAEPVMLVRTGNQPVVLEARPLDSAD